METVTLIFVMFIAVIVSSVLGRVLPFPIPVPLLQIALGAAIGMLPDLSMSLSPEVFLLLFLPPLLFLDGWRIPKEGLFRDIRLILALAIGLVIFTVLGAGYFINWMIPTMPLAVAFALAAVVSPTDPVAVSAIAERVPMPKRLMHVLEGESLLNDASGLVSLKFSVTAALTGTFVFTDAAQTFTHMSLGGVAIGTAVTWLGSRVKELIARRWGDDTAMQILISLTIPFVCYMIAEHLGCSGILAAGAAGITMSYIEFSGNDPAMTRMRGTAAWDLVQYSLNGLIFVLLGEQLPSIIHNASNAVQETGHLHPAWLIVYVLAINLALALLRFAWVWVWIRFNLYRSCRTTNTSVWWVSAVLSVSGARGSVSLAGVLTLPLLMNDGVTHFPSRDLAILLVSGVIIMSLIAASIFMPILLRRDLHLPPESEHRDATIRAQDIAARAAIRAIERAQHELSEGRPDADRYIDAASRVTNYYRYRIELRNKPNQEEQQESSAKVGEIENQLRLVGLRAERDELFRLVRRRRLNEETARRLIHNIDLREAQGAD